ncbi:MAG: LRV FeS4 cluster domain-containing protein, partial [Porticoccaceae bacterium]
MTERRLPRSEIDAAIDWTGRAVDCSHCPHRTLLEQTGCGPRWSCVQDRYARRIDRFFAMHPALANDYLSHPYFEVRAVAAKYTDLFRLPALLADPDETVRWSVAMRLPPRQLHKLSRDPDREVRIRVAARIDAAQLLQMIHDPDYYVRQIVARR